MEEAGRHRQIKNSTVKYIVSTGLSYNDFSQNSCPLRSQAKVDHRRNLCDIWKGEIKQESSFF